jgi:hypothetical protein
MGNTTIDRRWLPLNALRAFEGVAKHSSFTAAASCAGKSLAECIEANELVHVRLFDCPRHHLWSQFVLAVSNE